MSDRKHYPQLDGVRALAIVAVLIGHFLSDRFIAELVGWGDSGVLLFFCLSGFLITEILLKLETRPGLRSNGIKAFYARRMLRIFPIYYLVLVVGVAAGYHRIVENFWRLATYTLNVPGLPPTDHLGTAAHFWSLSVEEQFYLLWPTIVVFWPRANLRGLIVAIILASVAFKLILVHTGGNYKLVFWNVVGRMDALGLGALLALQKWQRRDDPAALVPFVRAGAIAAVIWAGLTIVRILMNVDLWYGGHLTFAVAHFAFGAVAFTGLVAFAITDSRNWLGTMLATRSVRYIGRISYGLYVYHFFMPYVLGAARARGYIAIAGDLHMALYSTILTLAVAVVSWHWFESPILRLKRHVEYEKVQVQMASGR